MTKALCWACVFLIGSSGAGAAEVKVNLSMPDERKDIVMPHWENWKFREVRSDSQEFNGVKVAFQATGQSTLHAIWFKALLEQGTRMSVTGITAKEGGDGKIVMT